MYLSKTFYLFVSSLSLLQLIYCLESIVGGSITKGSSNKCAHIPLWASRVDTNNETVPESRIVGGKDAEAPIPWQVLQRAYLYFFF